MYKIRHAKFDDMDFILSMAKNEGWDPGIYDAKAFFAADSSGFFVGELDGVIISCISAVKYQDFGFIGFYIVKNKLRGQRFGLEIWKQALDYLGDINVGLDGVVEQVENYKKFGFKLAHSNARYSGRFEAAKVDDKHILSAKEVDFEKLCQYDALHFGNRRGNFLKEWINQKEGFSSCYVKDNEIRGFAAVRKTSNGYKIGPLFAQNKDMAEVLMLDLVLKIGDADFYLDINEEFIPAVELVNKYGMTKVFETRRMYTKAQPHAKWGEVFGITSFELG